MTHRPLVLRMLPAGGLFAALLAGVLTFFATTRAAVGPAGERPVAAAWHPGDPDPKTPFALKQRVPWATSEVQGSPDPADPYQVVRVFPHLRFEGPLDIVCHPDGDRWFVSEHKAVIYSFANDANVERFDEFLDLRRKDHRYLGDAGNRQIWSMAFHPKFKSNGYFYVCYRDPSPSPARCRISRFQLDFKKLGTPPRADVDTETLIFEWPSPVDHFGGSLQFGPDGMLYCSAGDGGPIADYFDTGQDISDINASIIRIDVDHPNKAVPYSIPKDNPFVNMAGARGEVYAYGLRNVWKMSFDRKTGDLWGADVGQDLWDPVVKIESGGNYGWSVTEGSHDFRRDRKVGPTPILPPVVEHGHFEARSLTGGFVYRGSKYPELVGTYIYGDWATGKIFGFKYDAATRKAVGLRQLADTSLQVVAFGEDKDGELLILDYRGTINQLVPTPPVDATARRHEFPRLLSKTGLFASTKDMTPAAGLIPYGVNSPLWSDGALKERYLAIPGNAKIEYTTENAWNLPAGSVVVKTFMLEMEKGNKATARRLETRLLHNEHDHWRGYTYLWNEEQTDAVLLEDPRGRDQKFTVKDAAAPGGAREQVWHYPSRSECVLCHTMPANFLLGVNTLQMDRDFDYGHGAVGNQVRELEHLGMFTKPVADAYKKDGYAGRDDRVVVPPRLVDPADETQALEARARSYLHANCSHCHMRSGGGNSNFEVRVQQSLGETQLVNAPPRHGEFGLAKPGLIVPGEPDRSIVVHRMSTLGHGRMPQLASNVVDEAAVKVVRDWVVSLAGKR